MKFHNKILFQDSKKIIQSSLAFEKGTVSGFSIELFEPETESFTSYTYYDDEINRDKDFELLCQLK